MHDLKFKHLLDSNVLKDCKQNQLTEVEKMGDKKWGKQMDEMGDKISMTGKKEKKSDL